MSRLAVDVQRLSFFHSRWAMLQCESLTVEAGETIGLFGPNGGGKTTFLKLLMGFLIPGQGRIRIFGETPDNNRRRIGYVPQIHRADPDFPITLEELILLGCRPKRLFFQGFEKRESEACSFWMEKLGLLQHRHKAYGALSGGIAQRALLARALISNPDLLLLDEPTSSIDAQSLSIFQQTLEEIKGTKTILLVSHDLRTLVQRADRLLCVQGSIRSLAPSEICGHFALGIYHAPLEEPRAQLQNLAELGK